MTHTMLDRKADTPLYEQIRTCLMERISSGHYESRLPSEMELAEEFGVARPSVRRALAELESADMLTRRPALGTFVKAGFRPQLRSVTFLLHQAVPGQPAPEPMNSPIVLEVMAGVAEGARQRGIPFDLLPADYYDRASVVGRLGRLSANDGIVVLGYAPTVEAAAALGVPVVTCHHGRTDVGHVPRVSYQQERAVRLSVQHVLDCGARDVLYVIAEDPGSGAGAWKVRLVRETLQGQGVKLPMSRVLHASAEPGLTSVQVRHYLDHEPLPDAVLCSTDFVAAGVIDALYRLGHTIPGEVMVMGYCDFPIAGTTVPPLSTVRVPRFEIGLQAVEALARYVGGERREEELCFDLPVSLVHRETTPPTP